MYFGSTTEIDKYQTPSSVIFCPEEIGVDFVELHIGKHPFDNEPNGVPLSKATGMDEQTFHKLFTENPSACLTLNRKAFYPKVMELRLLCPNFVINFSADNHYSINEEN
jgi:hypothetical protein